MRLIDADALIDKANSNGAYGYVDAKQISDAPTVDAVPVVWCKDCVNGTFCLNSQGAEYVDCMLDNYSVRKPDDFCSYGKRKGCAD